MRIFAGLPIPREMIIKVANVCGYLREKYRGLNVVKSGGLHVTLYFFGEMPEPRANELIQLLDDQSLKQEKIGAKFSGFGQFPPKGNPRVLFVNIEQGKEEIASYYERFVKLIQSHGFGAPEEKEFVAHITVARNKREKLPRDFFESIPFTLQDGFTIDRCILYQSTLTPTGAVYKALKTILFS